MCSCFILSAGAAPVGAFTLQLVEEFQRFLEDEVNLNRSRIENLEGKVAAIQAFVEASDWGPFIRGFSQQGSWAHGTIIKPPGSKGFDADLLVMVDLVAGWGAADYLDRLYAVFRDSGIYRDKVTRKTRCVVVEYAGDFSLDVVPCVLNRAGSYSKEICNRRDNVYEPTDGQGFAEWWLKRCSFAPGDTVKEATRLLKYLRDIKSTFSAKSVLLTTLIGERGVNALDPHFGNLANLPTALKVIVGRLDDYLQGQTSMPDVRNPAMPDESFTRHWDEDKYSNFRSKVHTYREWIDDAFSEPDRDKSIAKWRDVFGEDFAAETVRSQARSVSVRYLSVPGAARAVNDAVASVKAAGRQILSRIPSSLPWVKRPRWRMAPASTVTVRATLHHRREPATRIGPLESGQIVPKSREILFEAVNAIGSPFQAADYVVWWRVVNTDDEAARNVKQLRGGFYASEAGPGRRWETTQYHGVHWVEAFVVRKRDDVCIGQSDRFFVVVE